MLLEYHNRTEREEKKWCQEVYHVQAHNVEHITRYSNIIRTYRRHGTCMGRARLLSQSSQSSVQSLRAMKRFIKNINCQHTPIETETMISLLKAITLYYYAHTH